MVVTSRSGVTRVVMGVTSRAGATREVLVSHQEREDSIHSVFILHVIFFFVENNYISSCENHKEKYNFVVGQDILYIESSPLSAFAI